MREGNADVGFCRVDAVDVGAEAGEGLAVRGEAIARETFKQRKDFHMRDGEERDARDKVFAEWSGRSEELEKSGTGFPSRWTCPVVQPWLYGYDAVKEADSAVRQ